MVLCKQQGFTFQYEKINTVPDSNDRLLVYEFTFQYEKINTLSPLIFTFIAVFYLHSNMKRLIHPTSWSNESLSSDYIPI